jgi:hypothetical protein
MSLKHIRAEVYEALRHPRASTSAVSRCAILLLV